MPLCSYLKTNYPTKTFEHLCHILQLFALLTVSLRHSGITFRISSSRATPSKKCLIWNPL